MLIDTHCHLHDREFFSEKDANEYLDNAKKSGIGQIICIGTNIEDSFSARDFAESHEDVFWTFGIHPEYATSSNINIDDLQKALKTSKKLVAIGEIGLDYHYSFETRKEQIKLLESLLDLAIKLKLPVSFHVREAFDDFFGVIKNFPDYDGVIHSFSDSKKNLKKLLETTKFYVGVNGLATYLTLPLPPIDRIVLETDAPFLTPEPNRGKINQPLYIKDIAIWLSKKTNLPLEVIEKETTKNGRKLFSLPNPNRD